MKKDLCMTHKVEPQPGNNCLHPVLVRALPGKPYELCPKQVKVDIWWVKAQRSLGGISWSIESVQDLFETIILECILYLNYHVLFQYSCFQKVWGLFLLHCSSASKKSEIILSCYTELWGMAGILVSSFGFMWSDFSAATSPLRFIVLFYLTFLWNSRNVDGLDTNVVVFFSFLFLFFIFRGHIFTIKKSRLHRVSRSLGRWL